MTELLLKAGRLFDGVSERLLENAYVAIDGGVIASLGRQAELEGGEGSFGRVLDLGPRATLLPGLINMHTHMSFSSGAAVLADHQRESVETKLIRSVENLKTALRTGVTTVRDCGTVNEIAFAMRAAVDDGTLVAPRIIASGAGVTTTGGHLWFCGVEADSEVEVRRAVRAQAKAGADFIKVFATGGNTTPGTNPLAAQYTEAEMRALTEEARRLHLPTASHAHGSPGVHHSIAARVTTVEHCTFLTADGVRYEPEQSRIMAGEGIYVCPTIFQGASKFAHLDDPEIPPAQRDFLRLQQARFELVNRLVDAGVRIVSGSDAGVAYNEFGDYPGDLILSVEGTGLSPAYILKSATGVAAEALGREDLGVLAPGKAADVLAVQGNPLEDIRALLDVRAVVARGRVVH
ncbi:MAG: amidohydrolase family protein [SAR324 cluster bacterium]|nr:amidohydrolase family protein [SAR324 cluster bacterium]